MDRCPVLNGKVITDPEKYLECTALCSILESYDFHTREFEYPEKARADAFTKLYEMFQVKGVPIPALPTSENNAGFFGDLRWASERAIEIETKGLAVGMKVLAGRYAKAPAEIAEITHNYHLRICYLDPLRKTKKGLLPPSEVEKEGQRTISLLDRTTGEVPGTKIPVVIEKIGGAWNAYFDSNPDIRGVRNSDSEAIGSLYVNEVGKLILKNPGQFGLAILKKPV